MMNNPALEYLDAMNITVWRLRPCRRLLVIYPCGYTLSPEELRLWHNILCFMDLGEDDVILRPATEGLSQDIKKIAPTMLLILGKDTAPALLTTETGYYERDYDENIPAARMHSLATLLAEPGRKKEAMQALLHFNSQT